MIQHNGRLTAIGPITALLCTRDGSTLFVTDFTAGTVNQWDVFNELSGKRIAGVGPIDSASADQQQPKTSAADSFEMELAAAIAASANSDDGKNSAAATAPATATDTKSQPLQTATSGTGIGTPALETPILRPWSLALDRTETKLYIGCEEQLYCYDRNTSTCWCDVTGPGTRY